MTVLAILALIVIPAVLAALALDTMRAAQRSGGYPAFDPTFRAYGA